MPSLNDVHRTFSRTLEHPAIHVNPEPISGEAQAECDASARNKLLVNALESKNHYLVDFATFCQFPISTVLIVWQPNCLARRSSFETVWFTFPAGTSKHWTICSLARAAAARGWGLLGKEGVEWFPGYSDFQEIRCRPKPEKLPRCPVTYFENQHYGATIRPSCLSRSIGL